MKTIFELLILPFSLFENLFYNYIVMSIIGIIAFYVAFGLVGEIGLRGELGSLAHWLIRTIIFVTIWAICCLIIMFVTFIINNWINMMLCVVLAILLYILRDYADNNKDCKLNNRLF